MSEGAELQSKQIEDSELTVDEQCYEEMNLSHRTMAPKTKLSRRRKFSIKDIVMKTMLLVTILIALKNYIFMVHTTTDFNSISLPNTYQFYPSEMKSNSNLKNDLLLSVPFYIYEELDWLDDKHITTVANHTFNEWVKLSASERNFDIKHDDDLKFYLAAARHPMRVKNPEEAKLFVVPTLTTYVATDHIYKDNRVRLCRDGRCGRELLVYADEVLKNSTWFQRSQGSDHFVLVTALLWQHHHQLEPWAFQHMIKCNALQFGEGNKNWNKKDRLSFDTFYVGTACPNVPFEEKSHDLAMIANLRIGGSRKRSGRDRINFKDRRNICKWSRSDKFTSKFSMSVCGKGVQCPALSKSRLGFHVQGDTISANRLFDTILSGTVPIFTKEKQFTAHRRFINWDLISYYLPMGDNTTETSFLQALGDIIGDAPGIEYKTQKVLENRDLFDWDTLIPFDTYMYMVQAHLWPDTRVAESKYSALILPPLIKVSSQS